MLAATPYIIVCCVVFYFKITLMAAVLYGCETWSLTVRPKHILRVFQNRVLREITRPEWECNKGIEKTT
jgi:hypothetical protein